MWEREPLRAIGFSFLPGGASRDQTQGPDLPEIGHFRLVGIQYHLVDSCGFSIEFS